MSRMFNKRESMVHSSTTSTLHLQGIIFVEILGNQIHGSTNMVHVAEGSFQIGQYPSLHDKLDSWEGK